MNFYLAIQHALIPDCPADLEVEASYHIGVFDSEAKALEAIQKVKAVTMKVDNEHGDFETAYPDLRFEVLPFVLNE